MRKRLVHIKMECDSTTLNTEGAIYRSPYHAGERPVVTGVRARRTAAAKFEIEPGRYEYRFDAQDDRGKFKLNALYGDAPPAFASDDYDTAIAMNDLQLVFTVVAERRT